MPNTLKIKRFKKALEAEGICLRRAKLYRPQLDHARETLTNIANDNNFNAANIPNASRAAAPPVPKTWTTMSSRAH